MRCSKTISSSNGCTPSCTRERIAGSTCDAMAASTRSSSTGQRVARRTRSRSQTGSFQPFRSTASSCRGDRRTRRVLAFFPPSAPALGGFLCPGLHLLSQAATRPPLLAGAPSGRQHIAMLPPPFPVTRGTARGGVVVIRIPLFALALGAFVGVAGASAQQRQITGQVTSSATREPMAGVNVAVTGTAFAAVSNADGRYAISAPAGAVTLRFPHNSVKRREVTGAAGPTTADAALEPDVFNLEAVVVTGQATGIEQRNAAIANTVVTAAERSEEHTSELQSRLHLVCRLLLEKKKGR